MNLGGKKEKGEREDKDRIWSVGRWTLSIIISPPFYGPFVNRPIEESLDCRSSFPQIEACMLMLIHGALSLFESRNGQNSFSAARIRAL